VIAELQLEASLAKDGKPVAALRIHLFSTAIAQHRRVLARERCELYRRVWCFQEGEMHVLWWIIVGLIAGWATGKIMRGSGYGALMDIVVGIVGAVIGGWIMSALGFSARGGMIYTILVAIGGAVVLTWLIRLITGNRATGSGSRDLRRVA